MFTLSFVHCTWMENIGGHSSKTAPVADAQNQLGFCFVTKVGHFPMERARFSKLFVRQLIHLCMFLMDTFSVSGISVLRFQSSALMC